MTRAQAKSQFIKAAQWAQAQITPLAGDASNRCYDRLVLRDKTRILMDAPPLQGQSADRFVALAHILSSYGYSTPIIHAQDIQNGFLLLEDLGDMLYANVLSADPGLSDQLYRVAVDLLGDLHQRAFRWDVHYDSAAYAKELRLLCEWYMPPKARAQVDAAGLIGAFQSAFDAVNTASKVLVLRDFHAENLLWLPARDGLARVGLLDFQDALIGHPAYDLVSLLEDARRDTTPDLRQTMLAHYLARYDGSPTDFIAAYNLLGAQRNLKILGIFARLSKRDHKTHYIHYIPRVWDHLQRNLRHHSCAELREWVDQNLPAPEPDILERLK